MLLHQVGEVVVGASPGIASQGGETTENFQPISSTFSPSKSQNSCLSGNPLSPTAAFW